MGFFSLIQRSFNATNQAPLSFIDDDTGIQKSGLRMISYIYVCGSL